MGCLATKKPKIGVRPRTGRTAFRDLSSLVFGRLTVVGYMGGRRWLCICECGALSEPKSYSLLSGHTTSCGCLTRENAALGSTTHGAVNTPAYQSWKGMRSRCTNKNRPDWRYYGGRGIKVCDRWLNSPGSFIADMGQPGPGLTLDRINNNGDYTPENCRWATRAEQRRNQGR